MPSSSSEDFSDIELGGSKNDYEEFDEETVSKPTGFQRFLESPGFNSVVVIAVILHVLWVIFLTTFISVSTSNWLYRLGYLAVILVFLQVVEVALRVTAYLKQICCRPGDMFDFLLVAICFCCVLYGSTEVFYADDSSDSGSGSESSSEEEEECIEANPWIVFSAVLFLRLWRFAKVLYAVQKERIRDLEDITRLHKPPPSSQDSFRSSSSRSKLFDPVTSDETRNRERTLEMEKSVLAAELRLAKEQLEKYKDQISDVLLREGLPATAEQLRKSDGSPGNSETKLNGARRAASLSNLKTASSSSSFASSPSSLHSSGNRSLSSSAGSSASSSASSSPEEKKKKKKKRSSSTSSSKKSSDR